MRQLRNALERATILAGGGMIQLEHFALQAGGRSARDSATDLEAMERETIVQVLRDTRGNKSKAAVRLGLSRTQLYVRLRKHGLPAATAEAPAL